MSNPPAPSSYVPSTPTAPGTNASGYSPNLSPTDINSGFATSRFLIDNPISNRAEARHMGDAPNAPTAQNVDAFLNSFGHLSAPEIAVWQTKLQQAGLLTAGKFTPGYADDATVAAMQTGIVESLRQNTGLVQVLSSRADAQALVNANSLKQTTSTDVINLTNPDSLNKALDAAFIKELGHGASDGAKAAFVKAFQGDEAGQQRGVFNAQQAGKQSDAQAALVQATGVGAGPVVAAGAAGAAGAAPVGGSNDAETFAHLVADGIGYDPNVIRAMVQQEGNFKGATGSFNFLNMKGTDGKWQSFSSVSEAAAAAIKNFGTKLYANVAAAKGAAPAVQIAAIAASPWDEGHYGGAGGPNLLRTYNSISGGQPLSLSEQVAGALPTQEVTSVSSSPADSAEAAARASDPTGAGAHDIANVYNSFLSILGKAGG